MARISLSKTAEFKLYAPTAKKVHLAGNFNSWDAKSLAARKDSQGNWIAKVNLKPGKYEYKFLVDGSWANDPRCNKCVPNAFGTQNCTLEVK